MRLKFHDSKNHAPIVHLPIPICVGENQCVALIFGQAFLFCMCFTVTVTLSVGYHATI